MDMMSRRRADQRARSVEHIAEPQTTKTRPRTNVLTNENLIADKLWTERLILIQTPVWIIAVVIVMLTGVLRTWNDIQYMLFSTAVACPSVLLPLLLQSRPAHNQVPWWHSYWFKLHVWVGILVFFGTYLGTAYFFDLMGMEYAFNVDWNLSSDVVGKGDQKVPLFMYPLTHAYFMSYFVVLMVADRFIVRHLNIRTAFGKTLVVLALSYVLALAETFFMAADMLSDFFLYRDRQRMMWLGSFGYATYFIVGLPIIRRMDSDGELWTSGRVVMEALASCMAILLLLELWSKVIGPL